jgi:hypothetical protein
MPRTDPAMAHDKWRAFSSLTQGFAERARGRALVLTVDDLQWGTGLDLEFLAHLPRAVDSAVMVVGTARTGSRSNHDSELEAWLARLGSQRALSALRLEGFGIGEVRAWFQACFPGIRIRLAGLLAQLLERDRGRGHVHARALAAVALAVPLLLVGVEADQRRHHATAHGHAQLDLVAAIGHEHDRPAARALHAARPRGGGAGPTDLGEQLVHGRGR